MTIPERDQERVFNACEELEQETIELLADLVRIPSENPGYKFEEKMYLEKGYTELYDEPITRGGETKVCEYLRPILESFCDETTIVASDPLRGNLVGIMNGGAGKSLALNAHVDTVPTGDHDEWVNCEGNPFNPLIKDDKLFGRGATDDKGPAAAAIMAVQAVLKAGFKLNGELQLHLTAGEESAEGDTLGPGWFIRENAKYKTDACIVAESSAPPHENGICICSPGASALNITVRGKPVHAAMRYRAIRAGYEGHEVAVSAVDKAYKIYRALYELEQEWGLKPDKSGLTPYGFPTIPIGWVKGHPRGIELPFFVPDHCELGMAVWRYWWEDRDEVRAEVNRVIDGVVQGDPWLRENPPVIDWCFDWPAFTIEREHSLTQAVASSFEAVYKKPALYQSWQPVSDATWYQNAGVPSILIGPGDYRVAHAIDEYIELRQLDPGMKIYALAVMEWLGYE